jgi:type I restriction enzyme S subunit
MNADGNSTWMRRANNYISGPDLRKLGGRAFDAKTVAFPKVGATIYTNKKRILASDAVVDNNVMGVTVTDSDTCLPEFLFYWFEGIDLAKLSSPGTVPSITAARVRAQKVMLPPVDEQRSIATVLSVLQRAIERQERLIALTAELKRGLMYKLFTEGTRGEPLKQPTRFGSVPASWSVVPLGECCQVQTGVAKGRKVNAGDALSVPYLRVANVQDGHLDLREIKEITIRGDERVRYSLRPGDVVLTEGGDLDKLGRGFIWNGEVADCVHQNHIFAVRPNRSRLSSEFVAYQTQSPYAKKYFLSVAHKTTNLACINTSKLKAFPVLIPSAEEQDEMVSVLQVLDRRRSLAAETLASLRSLFRTLLHQLMTARLRVQDLDLSALEEAKGRLKV